MIHRQLRQSSFARRCDSRAVLELLDLAAQPVQVGPFGRPFPLDRGELLAEGDDLVVPAYVRREEEVLDAVARQRGPGRVAPSFGSAWQVGFRRDLGRGGREGLVLGDRRRRREPARARGQASRKGRGGCRRTRGRPPRLSGGMSPARCDASEGDQFWAAKRPRQARPRPGRRSWSRRRKGRNVGNGRWRGEPIDRPVCCRRDECGLDQYSGLARQKRRNEAHHLRRPHSAGEC